MAAIIAKLFDDRQLRVAQEVIDYLLPRMERSFAAARAMVAALDEESLAGKRPVTVALARGVLNEQSGTGEEEEKAMDLGIKGREAVVEAAGKGLGTRSEGHRVGKGVGRTGRSRWSPYQ